MNDTPAIIDTEKPRPSAVNTKTLARIYLVALPLALYFFFSRNAQARWPWVAEIAIVLDVLIGGSGVLAFFSWWPTYFLFGDSTFAERLCRFGLKSMLWAVYLIPLVLLFGGLRHLLDSPIFF